MRLENTETGFQSFSTTVFETVSVDSCLHDQVQPVQVASLRGLVASLETVPIPKRG